LGTHCTLRYIHGTCTCAHSAECHGGPNEQTSRTTHAAPPQAARRAARPIHPGGGWARTGTGAWAGGRPQAGRPYALRRPARWARRRGRRVAHAAPPPQHGHGHADEWGEARASPGCAVEQRDRHTATGALAQVREKAPRIATVSGLSICAAHQRAVKGRKAHGATGC
jgi:hypothetical protein